MVVVVVGGGGNDVRLDQIDFMTAPKCKTHTQDILAVKMG